MHPHTKFGIPASKNIRDMHRTRSGKDGLTDGLTDGRTLRLLYASQSSFGGIKTDHTSQHLVQIHGPFLANSSSMFLAVILQGSSLISPSF